MFSSKDPTTADDKISQSNIEEAKASSAGNICELAQFTIGFFDWRRNWCEMSQPIQKENFGEYLGRETKVNSLVPEARYSRSDEVQMLPL